MRQYLENGRRYVQSSDFGDGERFWIEELLIVWCRRFVVHGSPACPATFLHPAGEHGSGVRRLRQPHLCRRRVTDATGEVAARRRGTDAREQRPDRQERVGADKRP